MYSASLQGYTVQNDVFYESDLLTVLQMPRKRISVSVDTKVLSVLADKATDLNTSISRMTEIALIAHAKKLGLIPEDYRPLGETRGGDRTQSETEDSDD